MRVVLGLCAFLAFAACSPAQRGYPPGVEQGFMQACERQSGVPGLCACTWDRIEAEIDPNDFAALERLPGPERDAHPLMRRIVDMRSACHASLTPAPAGQEPTPAP
ncbi:MAG TPA: hypothetical protein VEA80_06270 [Vitreimonas sp.]|uniref:hypothetical protein n=1 Tax=Vitreimonas sp. TaxID=3069702 RepID=UPI002D4AA83C|nr:hypothetical protein [Vitreimonas sp.]HYD87059.1 hypothetical protein [Vitreimonas sp.]